MKNKLSIDGKKIPEWVNQCNGDYLQIRNLPAHKLPSLDEVEALIGELTGDKNCSFKQSIWLFEQLSFLPSAASDKRLESDLITEIISKMFMQFPLWVGKNAVINLLSKLKWLPAPVEIIAELEAVYQPVGITISRAKSFKMVIEKMQTNADEASTKPADSKAVKLLVAENSLGQKLVVRFEINRTVYQNNISVVFTDLLRETAIGEQNKASRERGDLTYKGRILITDRWPAVDEFLTQSSLFNRATRLGLVEWLGSLANGIIVKIGDEDGFNTETIDLMICKSGFAQLMDAFEAVQAVEAAE